MKNLVFILTGIFFSQFTNIQAQVNANKLVVAPLNIGDKVPDFPISKIDNYKSPKARFSDFKGKFVIIDFWFGACQGCIESFTKMEELQRTFGNQIQIIMVNFESKEKIDQTFSKWKSLSSIYRNPKLPSIAGDTILHKLFPHQYYPHEVWIDQNGIVKAFTSVEDVNEITLQAMLKNGFANIDMKIDNLNFDDGKMPILSQLYPAHPNSLRYYSAILKFVPGLSGGWLKQVIDSTSKTVRVSRRNMTILELFTDAVTNGLILDPMKSAQFDFGKRVILKARDSTRYFQDLNQNITKGEWQSNNCFTYEAVMPLEQASRMNSHMLHDLERYFNITCTIELQKMKTWSLVRISGIDKIGSKGGRGLAYNDARRDTSKFQIFAGPSKWLIEAISKANEYTPFVFEDKTGYAKPIDIELDKGILFNLQKLKNELRTKYDLDLIAGYNNVEVLVLKENEN